MPRRWKDRQIQKVALVRPADAEQSEFEINVTTGFGSDVNVTNPSLAVGSAGFIAAADRLTLEATQLAVRAAVEAIRDRADFALPAAQVTDLKTVTVANPTANPETGLSKEATLELVRQQLVAINANTDLVEAILTTVRDEQHRRSDPLAAGSNYIGDSNPTRSRDFTNGKFRSVSTKVTAPAGGTAALQLANPVGSGVNLLLTEVQLGSSVAADFQIWFDSDLTTPTPVTPFMPNRAYEGLVPTRAVVQSGSTPTGGTQVGVLRIPANNPFHLDYTVVIPPGKTVGLRIVNPSLTATVEGYIGATWVEPA